MPNTSKPTSLCHLPQNGYDIRTVQELFGHQDVKTTMIYTCIQSLSKGTSSRRRSPRGGGGLAVRSPLDD